MEFTKEEVEEFRRMVEAKCQELGERQGWIKALEWVLSTAFDVGDPYGQAISPRVVEERLEELKGDD